MAVAVAVAVSGGVAAPVAVPVAVPVAGLTKRFFNQKDFLINVWGYTNCLNPKHPLRIKNSSRRGMANKMFWDPTDLASNKMVLFFLSLFKL